MDLEEEVGENLLPPRKFFGSDGYNLRDDLVNRLVDRGYEEAVSNQNLLRYKLDAHFSRLPPSYAKDVNLEKPEDVILHERLLCVAKDPDKRPAYNIRFLESLYTETRTVPCRSSPPFQSDFSVRIEDSIVELESCSMLEDLNLNIAKDSYKERELCTPIAVHEIIFSSTDKPKLLSQLSALLSDIGLNIREAHVFCTVDGFSLDVFEVDGWHAEDTDGLYKAIEIAIRKSKSSLLASPGGQLSVRRSPSLYKISESWEIDRRFLKIGEKIASGSCGDLHRGVYLDQDVAVKIIRAELLNEVLLDEFIQEVAILREVEHNNVVRFIGACTRSPFFIIVTEYMPGGSLFDYLQMNHSNMKLPQVLSFAIDVSKGMEYLHKKHIIHRDLKTANLLMNVNNVAKVADFGVARFQNRGGVMTAETGTYRWMAPEVINHLPYDHKADVFSFAIVLWELVTGKVPYDAMTPLQAALGVGQGMRPTIPKDAHPKLRDLMLCCWESSPELRPEFSQITSLLQSLLRHISAQPDVATS